LKGGIRILHCKVGLASERELGGEKMNNSKRSKGGEINILITTRAPMTLIKSKEGSIKGEAKRGGTTCHVSAHNGRNNPIKAESGRGARSPGE